MQLILALVSLLILMSPLEAQWKQLPETGSQPQQLTDRTGLAGQSGTGPELAAELVDPSANAKQHRAVVAVRIAGVELVNSNTAISALKLNEGHIQYQVDDQPAIDSTSTRMQFDNLSPGEHHIQAVLVDNDNHPVAEEATFTVYIP